MTGFLISAGEDFPPFIITDDGAVIDSDGNPVLAKGTNIPANLNMYKGRPFGIPSPDGTNTITIFPAWDANGKPHPSLGTTQMVASADRDLLAVKDSADGHGFGGDAFDDLVHSVSKQDLMAIEEIREKAACLPSVEADEIEKLAATTRVCQVFNSR